MANVSGAGTLWNLPNLDGMLFTPSQVQTSFVSRINRAATVQNTEFSMSSNYLLETAAQPAITETASLTAPTPTSYVRANEKNVNQIYQEKISLSYAKLSSGDRLRYAEVGTSGFAYNTAPGTNAAQSELDFQLRANLEQIRVNYEYTFLNGAYQLGTDAGTAYKSRGIITGSTTNTVAASAATLTKDIIDSLLIEMAGNGAFDLGGNMVIFANAFQVKKSMTFMVLPQEMSPPVVLVLIKSSLLLGCLMLYITQESQPTPFFLPTWVLVALFSSLYQVNLLLMVTWFWKCFLKLVHQKIGSFMLN
jgi:hypothetical protein